VVDNVPRLTSNYIRGPSIRPCYSLQVTGRQYLDCVHFFTHLMTSLNQTDGFRGVSFRSVCRQLTDHGVRGLVPTSAQLLRAPVSEDTELSFVVAPTLVQCSVERLAVAARGQWNRVTTMSSVPTEVCSCRIHVHIPSEDWDRKKLWELRESNKENQTVLNWNQWWVIVTFVTN